MDDGKLLYVSYILSFDEERKLLIIYIKFKDQGVDDGGIIFLKVPISFAEIQQEKNSKKSTMKSCKKKSAHENILFLNSSFKAPSSARFLIEDQVMDNGTYNSQKCRYPSSKHNNKRRIRRNRR